MGNDLQLGDYTDGYRFACRCRVCGFTWYEQPTELLRHGGIHSHMYLNEVAEALSCRRTRDHPDKSQQNIALTPIRDRKDHHFIGGLA